MSKLGIGRVGPDGGTAGGSGAGHRPHRSGSRLRRRTTRVRITAASVLLVLLVAGAPGPLAVAQSPAPSGRLFVANSGSDSVSVIDTETNAVVATIAVGDRPTGVAAPQPSGDRVYVTNEFSGTVSVIDTRTLAVLATVPVGARPTGVAVSPVGSEVWVANAGSHNVSVISTATNALVATVPVGVSPLGVAFSTDAQRAYVTSQDDTVWILDTATRTTTATVPVDHSPFGIAVAGEKVYVTNQSSLTVSAIVGSAVVADIPVGRDPTGITVVGGTGAYVFVANQSSDIVSAIRVATDTVIEWFPAARPHSLASSTKGERVYATGMAQGGVVTVIGGGVTVPVGDFPEGIAFVATPSPPVISGQTWFSTGAKSRTGPAGSPVAAYAVGASQGVPYQLVLSRTSACADLVSVLNPTTVTAGPTGLLGTVRGTIPAGTPAGTYWICFRHTAGATATGVVTFTVV